MRFALLIAAALALPACAPASGQYRWDTVPQVNHAARDIKDVTLLVVAEATVEADDPEAARLMNERNTGARLRDALARALDDAGFSVVRSKERPFELEARLHVHSIGAGDARREEYRLTLQRGDDIVDAIPWVWPKDVIVALDKLSEYAANNLVNALVDSRRLAEWAAAPGRSKAVAVASGPAPAAGPPGVMQLVAASPQPASYAVVIGVERYRDLPPPVGARHDAEAFAGMLRRTLGLKEDHIRLALDDRATRTDLEKHLAWAKSEVPAGSRVYLFFSGHGAPEIASGSPYLLPYDADSKMVESTGIALSGVLKTLGEGRSKEVLVMIDACFSGAGGRSVLPPGARPLVKVKEAEPAPRVALFSATGPSEISGPAPGTAEGLFTRTVVEAIGTGKADADGDGQISLQELADWVKPRVSREAMKEHRAQNPTLTIGGAIGAAANFVVGYGYAPR